MSKYTKEEIAVWKAVHGIEPPDMTIEAPIAIPYNKRAISRVQRQVITIQEKTRIANNPLLRDMNRDARIKGAIIAFKRNIKRRIKSSIIFIANILDIRWKLC